MMLHVLDMPDDPKQLAAWLETRLMSGDLSALIGQLSVVHGSTDQSAASLDSVLADKREAVLRNGLFVLTTQQLSELLAHPQLLLELQELAIVEGGPYWSQAAARSAELHAAKERAREQVRRGLAEEAVELRVADARFPERSGTSIGRKLISIWAVAATLLAGFFLYERSSELAPAQPIAVAWGWGKADALPQNASADEYLAKIAASAKAWSAKRPTDAAGVAKRISEFRQGCSTLILAEHKPLSQERRIVLREKCRNWAKELDSYLAEVEAGKDPVEIRAKVDALVERLTKTLQTV